MGWPEATAKFEEAHDRLEAMERHHAELVAEFNELEKRIVLMDRAVTAARAARKDALLAVQWEMAKLVSECEGVR